MKSRVAVTSRSCSVDSIAATERHFEPSIIEQPTDANYIVSLTISRLIPACSITRFDLQRFARTINGEEKFTEA